MLIRGIHSYTPRVEDHNHTLPFKRNDRLLFVDSLKEDLNWIKVIDVSGRIGYAPINFVEPDDHFDDRDTIIGFLMDAIVAARRADLPSQVNLEALRDEVFDRPEKVDRLAKQMTKSFLAATEEKARKAHKSKSASVTSVVTGTSTASSVITSPKRYSARRISSDTDMRTKPCRTHLTSIKQEYIDSDSSLPTPFDGTETDDFTDNGGGDCLRPLPVKTESIRSKLVSVVQESSGLDLEHSQNLLVDVFQQIKDCPGNLPLTSLLEDLASPPVKRDNSVQDLKIAIEIVSNRSKENLKARRPSGANVVVPETSLFSRELDNLSSTLLNCAPSEVGGVLQADFYTLPHSLVQLYHLESPPQVKEKLLDIFLILCTGNRKVRNVLLSTTLPLTMVREIMAGMRGNRIFKQQTDLLTSLLTCGDKMRGSHFDIMGTGFANFMLTEIEHAYAASSEGDWDYDKLPNEIAAVINLMLAFNLQFSESDNFVLRVLAEYRQRPKGFVSIVLQQFKKAEDPLKQDLEDNSNLYNEVPNSVIKMVQDLCSCRRTRGYLFGKEKLDLVKIIEDKLINTEAGSIRLGSIQLLQGILTNGFDGDLKGIRVALLNILLDTDPLAILEQKLVRAISTQFPEIFKNFIVQMHTNADIGSGSRGDVGGGDAHDKCFYL